MPVDSGTAAKLCSADYHGAELEVVRSRCVGRVGVRGIVVRDSKFAFLLITEGNKLKTVPKEHTIFRFTVPRPPVVGNEEVQRMDGEKEVSGGEDAVKKDFVFELHGDQFIFRAVDRAMRKFKPKFNTDL